MDLQPVIAQDFTTASPFLIQVLKLYAVPGNFESLKCLDIPSGDGRNTFLLAESFKEVTAIDINKKHLAAIVKQPAPAAVIHTRRVDILNENLTVLTEFGFICNIHFYNAQLTAQLLIGMRPNTYLLLETPACHGENFRTLPNEAELKLIFKNVTVLSYEFKQCKHLDNKEQRGRLKALIKRDGDA